MNRKQFLKQLGLLSGAALVVGKVAKELSETKESWAESEHEITFTMIPDDQVKSGMYCVATTLECYVEDQDIILGLKK